MHDHARHAHPALVHTCHLQGVLSQMDTKNPVLYLDFPAGRLKLFGTLAFPHNKYMVLRLGGGSSVLCEDVFETLVGGQGCVSLVPPLMLGTGLPDGGGAVW